MARAQQMTVSARFGARNPFALAGRAGGTAVEALRDLERHQRTPGGDPQEEAAVQIGSLFLENADVDSDARLTQTRNPASIHPFVGIFHRDDDTLETGRDQPIGAGWRLSVVRTGFERDVGCSAARRYAGRFECHRLSMRPPAFLSASAADDAAVRRDDHAADGRIGCNGAERPLGQTQGMAHVTMIVACAHSPPSISPMSASKSLVSRKLR